MTACTCNSFSSATSTAALTVNNTSTGDGIACSAANSAKSACWGDNSAGGYGLVGSASGGTSSTGVYGVCHNSGAGYGVKGTSDGSGYGVYGTSSTGIGVYGNVTGGSYSSAVYGYNGSGAQSYGVRGVANGTSGYGVYGEAYGIYGSGVYAYAHDGNSQGLTTGLYAVSDTSHGGIGYGTISQGFVGVLGFSSVNSDSGYGIWGQGGIGVYGEIVFQTGTTNSNPVAGLFHSNDRGLAIDAYGLVHVSGYITKSGGGFRIDHPTDPENKYLNHEFVESEKAKNIYDGSVTFDDKGNAQISMSDWYGHVNSDSRLILTCREVFMPLCSKKVSEGVWTVSGGTPGAVADYFVIATRSDQWQKENHPGIVMEKPEGEKGLYRHPELFGKTKAHSTSVHARNAYARQEHFLKTGEHISDKFKNNAPKESK